MTALASVAVVKVPRVPHEMMLRVEARRLRVGDYLPYQRRIITEIEVVQRGTTNTLRVVSTPPHQPNRRRVHVWLPSTPVLMVPKPD